MDERKRLHDSQMKDAERDRAEMMRGVQFWKDAIQDAGLRDKLHRFNDILTGKQAPGGYDHGPSLTDVVIADKICDVYHTDGHVNDKKKGFSGERIFIHIKANAPE